MEKRVIYLDNASTTPVYREVVKVMNEYYLDRYGNAGSAHSLGEEARLAINHAKKLLSSEIHAKPWEIVFTSGGTESNNLALRGLALARPARKKIVISCIEHSSIYEECMYLKTKGYEIVDIPVDKEGLIDFVRLENEIDDSTLIVSVIHANNEIGVLQDLGVIGEICRAKNVVFHTDAVQSFGKEKIDVNTMKIDMLSASAHKIGGPKGIGLLYINEEIEITPIILGGGQEAGKRAGTENVPAIVGFAKALEVTRKIDKEKNRKTRDYFISELEKLGGRLNGSKAKRLCNNVNVSFKEREGEMIVMQLSDRGIMCSTKSACLSMQKKENRVLESLLLGKKEINGALRFTLSEKIKKDDIDITIKELKKILKND